MPKSKNKKIRIAHTIAISVLVVFGIAEIALVTWNWNIGSDQDVIALAKAPENYMSAASNNLASLIGEEITLIHGDQQFIIDETTYESWLQTYERNYTQKIESRINTSQVERFVTDITPGVDRSPIDGKFAMVNGIMTERVPAVLGARVNIPRSVETIVRELARGRTIVELNVDDISPEITLDTLRELEITTLLGKGESDFSGSSQSRVHNIGVGAERFNGILVPPGEVFSFNENVGDINAAAGYLPGLIIKGDKLIPEYGGGICQVSTTLFRSAMYAGLEIVDRSAHSLPVSYYNPQGFDATIYTGVVDLKFKNDTPSFILIQSYINGGELVFEIYGKPDGREVALTLPVIYDAPGDGSLKAMMSRTIIDANGVEDSERFYSSYRAPALFEVIRNPLE